MDSPAKLKYLPVPRNSLVVVYGMGDEDKPGSTHQEDMQALVEQLIVASEHNDFLVIEAFDKDSDIEVVVEADILDWLASKRKPEPQVITSSDA